MKKLFLSILLVGAFSAGAQITPVNVGSVPNDPAADNVRTAFQKINTNFLNLPVKPGLLSANAGLQAAYAGNLVFVDPVIGDDDNTYPGPYQTIPAAQSNAVSGDTIVVKPGVYPSVISGFANNVNWYFQEGAEIYSYPFGTFGSADATNLAFSVKGRGKFGVLMMANAGSTSWEFKTATNLVPYATGTPGSKFSVKADEIRNYYCTNPDTNSANIEVHLDVKKIFVESYFYGPVPPGKTYVRNASISNAYIMLSQPLSISFENCKIATAPQGLAPFIELAGAGNVYLSLKDCDIRADMIIAGQGFGETFTASATGCRFASSTPLSDGGGDTGTFIISGCVSTNNITTAGGITVVGSPTVANWTLLP